MVLHLYPFRKRDKEELLAKSTQYQNAVIHCPPVAKASKAVLFPEYFHSLIQSVLKHLPANAGDTRDAGLIPGLGRSPGVGNSNSLQYSSLEIPWTEKPGRL